MSLLLSFAIFLLALTTLAAATQNSAESYYKSAKVSYAEAKKISSYVEGKTRRDRKQLLILATTYFLMSHQKGHKKALAQAEETFKRLRNLDIDTPRSHDVARLERAILEGEYEKMGKVRRYDKTKFGRGSAAYDKALDYHARYRLPASSHFSPKEVTSDTVIVDLKVIEDELLMAIPHFVAASRKGNEVGLARAQAAYTLLQEIQTYKVEHKIFWVCDGLTDAKCKIEDEERRRNSQ